MYQKFPETRNVKVIEFSSLIECSNLLAKLSGGIGILKIVGEKSNNELRSAVEYIIFSISDR